MTSFWDDARFGLWPGESVAGRTVRIGGRSHQIVGVVRAAQYHAIGEEAVPYLFLNYWQPNAGRLVGRFTDARPRQRRCRGDDASDPT